MPNRSSKAGASQQGYTLVELLVVLTIMALLALSMPVLLSAGRPGVSLRVATSDIASALNQARQSAITSGNETAIAFDPRARGFTVLPGIRKYRLPGQIALGFRSAGLEPASTIHFFADGSSSGGTVTLRSGSKVSRITAGWLTGKVTINDP